MLHPAPTKALYFVADGTGGHVFADTLAEHQANVAKWYAIRRASGADVRNRGIGRARMFIGGLLLFAAVIAWGTSLMMSPHGEVDRRGTEHVRTTVVTFLRNSAIGTLVLCALAAWLLFPAAAAELAARATMRSWRCSRVLVASSLYQLVWLQSRSFAEPASASLRT